MFTAPATAEEVKDLVLNLSPYKAAGIDGFNAKTVKKCTPHNIKPYNLCI
jgi:hypothetical protein